MQTNNNRVRLASLSSAAFLAAVSWGLINKSWSIPAASAQGLSEADVASAMAFMEAKEPWSIANTKVHIRHSFPMDLETGGGHRIDSLQALAIIEMVESAAADHDVPAGGLLYLLYLESRLYPDRESSAGAVGLGQFMLHTALGWGRDGESGLLSLPAMKRTHYSAAYYDAFHAPSKERRAALKAVTDEMLSDPEVVDHRRNPEKNVRATAQYLRYLYEGTGSESWGLAAAAYNAGSGTLARLMKGKSTRMPASTQRYVATLWSPFGDDCNALHDIIVECGGAVAVADDGVTPL